jgi:hypothetical protein
MTKNEQSQMTVIEDSTSKFSLENNIMFVEVTFDSKTSGKFLIDNGCETTVFSLDFWINHVDTTKFTLIEDDKMMRLYACNIPYSIGNTYFTLNTVLVFSPNIDKKFLSGLPTCDGIIGVDVFYEKKVAINFTDSTISFFDSIYIDNKSFCEIPLTTAGYRKYVTISNFINKNNDTLSDKFMVDIGCNSGLVCKKSFFEKIIMGESIDTIPVASPIATFLSTVITHKIDSLYLKNILLNNVIIYADVSGRDYNILGNLILMSYNLLFDYSNNVLYLRPALLDTDPLKPHKVACKEFSNQ